MKENKEERKDKYGQIINPGDKIISKGFVNVPYIVCRLSDGALGIKQSEKEQGFHITESAWFNAEIVES